MDYTILSAMGYGMTASGIYVVVHAAIDPPASAWDAYFAHMADAAPAIQGLLVYTMGGGPSAKQRQQITSFWKTYGSNPPTAVVTSKQAVRTAITALNWFMVRPLRAFPPHELLAACRGLGLPFEAQQEAQELVARIAAKLGLPPVGGSSQPHAD